MKLDSMWYHEDKKNGKLASSHIAILFCALATSGVIVDDLLEFEFQGIPRNFSDRTVSPMDYCLAYTDGELFDDYIKVKYRKYITNLFDNDKVYDILFGMKGMQHSNRNETYTLECNWHNVDIAVDWLRDQLVCLLRQEV